MVGGNAVSIALKSFCVIASAAEAILFIRGKDYFVDVIKIFTTLLAMTKEQQSTIIKSYGQESKNSD